MFTTASFSCVKKKDAEVSNLISLAEFKALANLCYTTLHSELSLNSFVLLSANRNLGHACHADLKGKSTNFTKGFLLLFFT